jgi:hypothetical protein
VNLQIRRDDDDDDEPPPPLLERRLNNPFYRRSDGGYTLVAKRKIVEMAHPQEGPRKVRRIANESGIYHSMVISWKRLFKSLTNPSLNAMMSTKKMYYTLERSTLGCTVL